MSINFKNDWFLCIVGQCSSDSDCSADLSCASGKCIDPCSLRAACGENALCSVVLHKPRCECPQCYVGRPHVRCRPSNDCDNVPTRPQVAEREDCQDDTDCSDSTACVKSTGQCLNPCSSKSCDLNKQCIVTNHKPQCQCKYSLVINQEGALTCPDRQVECRQDNDCPSNQACDQGRCKNPCDNQRICPSGKDCQVLNHKATCVCIEGCNPSVSICLKDRGCPSHQACVNFQCKNPCDDITCPDNTPCEVENHKAVCKFCPEGFIIDANYGCIKGIEAWIMYEHAATNLVCCGLVG